MAITVEKLVCMLTQLYDAPSGKIRKRFVVILSVELDGDRARKCNAERVIFFNLLSYNAHKALTILRKFASAFCFESISGIVGHFMSSCKTRITPLWDTSENPTGIKWRSNIIERFRTLS